MSSVLDGVVLINGVVAGAILLCRLYLDILMRNTYLGEQEKTLRDICSAGVILVLVISTILGTTGVR